MLAVVSILGAIFLAFCQLPLTFFQQDEWGAFSSTILWQSLPRMEAVKNFLSLGSFIHFTPLANLAFFLFSCLAGLNFPLYAFLSLTLHFINSLLVFNLAWLLTKKKDLALVSALLFSVNSLSHQAVTWIASSINTQGACLFLLLSLIFLIKQKPLFSLFAFAFSLGFKETSAFLFILWPFLGLILAEKKDIFSLKKLLKPFFIFALFYFGLRLFLFLNVPVPPQEAAILFKPSKLVYLYRFIALPLRVLPQSLIPASQIIDFARKLTHLAYPDLVAADGVANPYIVETVAFDLICLLLAIFILLASFYFYRYLKKAGEKELSKGLFFSLALILTSVLPFVFIAGRAGYVSIFEPRNLYLTVIGSSLFFGLSLFTLSHWLSSKRFFRWVLMIVFLAPILFFHIKNIRADIGQVIANSQLRKSILNQIISVYPHLPEKAVFYTESDTAYYGLADEEKILPFQSGLGQTLLIWYYYHGEKLPLCFFKDLWLYLIESQGYKHCQDRGFGYFRKYDDLVKALKENNLSPENVIAYRFDSKDSSLTDITLGVREKIMK